jgi:hypothetical protein
MRRSSKLFPLLLAVFALAFAPACGSTVDDDNDTPDAANGGDPPDAMAATPDAMMGQSAESLGQPCAGAAQQACPAGYECIGLQDLGSETQGFCTISCEGQNDMTTCSNGYTGPGQPACALSAGATSSCAVLCETPGADGQCPTGLGCFDTGQGVGICAGIEGTDQDPNN